MKPYAIFLSILLVNVAAREEKSPSDTDIMAKNILEWIQGIYRHGIRKIRQQSDNAYLPPYNIQRSPEKPRPFQSVPAQQFASFSSSTSNKMSEAYPDYSSPSSVNLGYSSNRLPSGYPASSTSYLPPSQTPISIESRYPYSTVDNRPKPNFPTPDPRFISSSASGLGSRSRPGFISGPNSTPDIRSQSSFGSKSIFNSTPASAQTSGFNSMPTPQSGNDDDDDDLTHPPHIHSLNVECSKTMMTVNIEFNRLFNGVIYSKGFFMMPQCRYVEQNTGQIKYSFTLNLDSCGTQFINDFEGEAGQAYLENILVLQNEPSIQEVWDTVRAVRCLWEGNINKALKVNLSVDMLNQELVTFSGDTATAKLDVQVGKGPFAPAANGLVKIGDTMTLVVSVEGDPAFDLLVRDCIARDESSTNMYILTDERGCILKPKIFGAFQKTNETGNSGASIIAYAYFQAFKFPDIMDLFIECNIELCKTNCEPCPVANQQIEPGRRRRSIIFSSSTNTTPKHGTEVIRIGRSFRIITPEDLSKSSELIPNDKLLNNNQELEMKKIQTQLSSVELPGSTIYLNCTSFYAYSIIFLITLIFCCLTIVLVYIKLRLIYFKNGYDFSNCS